MVSWGRGLPPAAFTPAAARTFADKGGSARARSSRRVMSAFALMLGHVLVLAYMFATLGIVPFLMAVAVVGARVSRRTVVLAWNWMAAAAVMCAFIVHITTS